MCSLMIQRIKWPKEASKIRSYMAYRSLFRTSDGRNHLGIFGLISSLFFLWALCNGMIDVMDKHFQDFLHLTKAQSAWVQFAHYLGYFLMALPAGWLARKLGYKAGILAGLGGVALGCLWFIPATQISTFWAFLLGVCVISMGLTFLETIANPYTTVLGAPQFAAVRINIAQSFNGVGWILGPIIGGMFFYSSEGAEVAHQQLWIPYAGIAGGLRTHVEQKISALRTGFHQCGNQIATGFVGLVGRLVLPACAHR
jgi:FHS family L-fucose permease-like MFS transporter